MTETCATLTREKDSARAGVQLGRAIRDAFRGAPADAVAVFASARHDYARLLGALAESAGTRVLAGSSSAGEFTAHARGEGQVSALALRSDSMRFAVACGRGVGADPAAAAADVVAGLTGVSSPPMPYRAAMVMTDALAGHADVLVERLTVLTGGNYLMFGGGAGDDARFATTHVFAGTDAFTDGVVALEMLSMQPLGVGVAHGWEPASAPLRVTQASAMRLASLNGEPALRAIEAHARSTGQKFDRADPLPFFLHNILGVRDNGGYRLRVPLAVHADGSLALAAEIPEGALVHIMRTSQASAVDAAKRATNAALAVLGGRPPAGALVFDCVATRLRLGQGFDQELAACSELLSPAEFVGCNTYGQIARAEGQFSGFHNCTAVVCAIPR